MPSDQKTAARVIVGLLAVLGAVGAAGAEDTVTLKDGTKISATTARQERDSVIVQLDRGHVAAINGQPLPDMVAEGSPAPDFTAVDLTGVTRALSDPSAKVTVVKFWASWCPYCRTDISVMKDLYARYHGTGLQILAVSVDQDLDKLRALVEKEQLPYPVIATAGPSVSAQQAAIPERYETQGIPAYFVIANGKIAKTISGSVTAGKQDLETPIKQLLQ